jgi:hypothetical protein
MNAGKSKNMFMSYHQNAGQNHHVKIAKKSFENVGTTVTHQNYIQRNFFNLLTYLFTHSLTHSLTPWCRIFFEKLSLGLSKSILLSLWNPKVHYRSHKSPPPDSILSQQNPVAPSIPVFLRSILMLTSHLRLSRIHKESKSKLNSGNVCFMISIPPAPT